MKRLLAIRLINWYHFVDQVFHIDGCGLLMGESGSGKSTVLDAVQLALVADLTEVRFNKAANENSRRSLYGYVRHKLGSELEGRPGQQRFGREGCTSYVLVEFRDDRDPNESFVAGIVLEATLSDTEVARSHFLLLRTRVEDVPAISGDDVVRPPREFRALLRGVPEAKLCPDVAAYRDELRQRLGVLPQSFHRLIVKALDFKPIGQVRQFVFNYLLDEQRVDTESLQRNLENYKRLEAESRDAERRIAALDELCELGARITTERRTIESHRYVSLSAARWRVECTVRETNDELAEAQRLLGVAEAETERLNKHIRFLEGEQQRIEALLQQQAAYQELARLESDLAKIEAESERAKEADTEARRLLALQMGALEALLDEPMRDLRRARLEFQVDDLLVGATSLPDVVERLRATLERSGALGGRDIATWNRRLASALEALNLAKLRIEDSLEKAKEEGQQLSSERNEIERSGRQRYSDSVAALLHLLRAKLKGAREPQPLCELVEVENDRWRDAVEGYLNTRRFDVIVAAKDFPRALSLYDKHKGGYSLPGRGDVFIGGVGLVDIERIEARPRRVERRSLAEQVATDDPLARVYCDHLLGDVICCESEQELRSHARAITDTVMVYQNHVARQTPRDVYSRPFLGRAAQLRRRDAIDARLGELHTMFVQQAGDREAIATCIKVCDKARIEVSRLPGLIADAEQLPFLTKQAATLRKQIDRIDRSEIEKLVGDQEEVKEELASHRLKIRTFDKEAGVQKNRVEVADNALVKLKSELADATAFVEEFVATMTTDRRAALEEHFLGLRDSEDALALEKKYEIQRKNIESRVAGQLRDLVKRKAEYVNRFGFGGDAASEDWQEFADERDAWRDSRLPEYRTRITEAKDQSIQQLAEDIIFRLRENLLTVKRQLDDLNAALKEVAFGTDRYSFVRSVAPDHREFHDLIMEAGRYEKESLFGATALSSGDTKRTLEGLFNRLVSGEAHEVKSELEAKADYREYFDYDIHIHHADNTYSSYDRVAGDKSGGETQTPYYIAIFASMFRMYRQRALDRQPSCGVVLLDEAFAKLDGARTQATVRFARGLGLQVIVAAAEGKSEFVAPCVETTLLVLKDARSGAPTVLDFTKEFAADEPRAVEGDDGRSATPAGSP